MSCPICCESFTKSQRALVKCINHECDQVVCKTCFQNYILTSAVEPHCMTCKSVFTREMLMDICGPTFVKGKLRTIRKKQLVERQSARFPQTMRAVQRDIEKEKCLGELEEVKVEIQRQMELRREIERRLRLLSSGLSDDKVKFTMKCTVPDCKGFLSTQYRCGLCETYTCSKCFGIIGKNKQESDHVCSEADIANAETIRASTKPCPKCGERIEKVSGCDQMWCTQCETPFSWNSGRILIGVRLHNPHWHEAQQALNRNLREQGDVPCGGIPRGIGNKLRRSTFHTCAQGKRLLNYVYNIIHIANEVSHANQERLRLLQNFEPLDVKYLRGKITKERWETLLAQRDNEHNYLREKAYIYDLVVTLGVERMNAIVALIDQSRDNFQQHQELARILEDFEGIDTLVRKQNEKLSKTYQRSSGAKGIVYHKYY